MPQNMFVHKIRILTAIRMLATIAQLPTVTAAAAVMLTTASSSAKTEKVRVLSLLFA